MVRTQIQLSEKQAQALGRLAAKHSRSMAALVREGVDWVIRHREGTDWEERKARAIAVCGKFRSGKRDISIRHDDYLAKAYRGQ